MTLLESLLDAIVRLEGDALVMHVGEKPYVVTTTMNPYRGPLAWGQVELSSRVLTPDAVLSMVGQILPPDQRHALDELGAVEHEVASPSGVADTFTVVAARGGDDIWLELRRHPVEAAAASLETGRSASEHARPAEAAASGAAEAASPAVGLEEPPAFGHAAPPTDSDLQESAAAPAGEPDGVADSHDVQSPSARIEERVPVMDEVRHHEADHLEHVVIPLETDRRPDEGAETSLELVEPEPQGVPTEADVEALLAASASALLSSGPVLQRGDEAASVTSAYDDELFEVVIENDAEDSARAVASDAASDEEELVDLTAALDEMPASELSADLLSDAPAASVEATAPAAVPGEAVEPAHVEAVAIEVSAGADEEPEPGRAVLAEPPAEPGAPAQVGTVAPEMGKIVVEQAGPAGAAGAEEPVASDHAGPPAVETGEVGVGETEPAGAAQPPLEGEHGVDAAAERVEPVALPDAAVPTGESGLESHAQAAIEDLLPDTTYEAGEAPRVDAPHHIQQPLVADVGRREPTSIPIEPEIPLEKTTTLPVPDRTPAVPAAPAIAANAPGVAHGGVVLPIERGTAAVGRPAAGSPVDDQALVQILRVAADRGASTVYVVAQARPMIRLDGEISTLEDEPILRGDHIEQLASTLAPRREGQAKIEPGVEWISEVAQVGRVRCVTFRDHRGPGITFRLVSQKSISAEHLNLSPELRELAALSDGLVVVTGARGSGKSTLLNSFVDLINRSRGDHVITVETSIEFAHESRRSFISQREVGADSAAAAAAIGAALREDPDVLVIEDLHSAAAVIAALHAAESGRLVFVSIAAPSSADALDALVALVPDAERPAARAVLAGVLRGVVAQVLLRRSSGGRAAARELLLNSPKVSACVAEGKMSALAAAFEGGQRHGMVSLNEALAALVRGGAVHAAEAWRRAPDRAALLASLARDGIDTAFAERLA